MKTGRGRGKGKKQSLNGAYDEAGSGEDEKFPSRRRGRPQKPVKEGDPDKMEEDDGPEGVKTSAFTSHNNELTATDNGKKRKTNEDPVNEENGSEPRTNAADFTKAIGFRQVGSRRKNKPRRAAEVGVECV